ncbi:MAG: HEAT repeat domain-containing protein [Anaerolineae bacterium]|nr:HEAT repeat domain-containing protein [Anaerolineae bacterium]
MPNTVWHFDLRSAIIGAIAAWIIAVFIYARRERVRELALTLWSPVGRLRDMLQSSQEDRYARGLQEALRSLLLFAPSEPLMVFQPPTFLAPPSIHEGVLEVEPFPPARLEVSFENLIEGHPYIVITGPQTAGRTTALVMTLWKTINPPKSRKPYIRFPLWLDLAQFKNLPEGGTPQERLAQLSNLMLPNFLPKWVMNHLQRESTLIVADNWESLPPDLRPEVARWIGETIAALPNSIWIIAAGEDGYGNLVENGFVPLEIRPTEDVHVGEAIYAGWAAMMRKSPEIPEDVSKTLHWARQAGASLLEIHLRVMLYLRTQQLPVQPVEVMDFLLDTYIPLLNLGEGQEEIAEQARTQALATLSYVAKAYRLEGREFTRQEINEWAAQMLPVEDEQRVKVENAVRRLVFDAGLLASRGRAWVPAHYLWSDFLTAWDLVADNVGADMAQAHLHDPTWAFILEFYVALGDATKMVGSLLREASNYGNLASLLRAARWCILAPADAPWRKTLIKTLAQTFSDPELEMAQRLQVGRKLMMAAGEGSRAFFVQSVRSPSLSVRCAALRGIGWSGSTKDMPLLASALKEPELEIATSAIEALADLGTAGAARLLQQTLEEADEHLILPVAIALARIPEGQEALQQVADSEDLMLRRAAAHGLSGVQEPWSRALLEKMAREDNEWLVRSAAETALKAWEEQATSKIVPLSPPKIESLEWLIAWAASQGTGMGVGAAAMRMLARAIVEGNAQSKILGALTLIYTGDTRHLQILEPLLENEDPHVRRAATLAVEQIRRRYYVYQGN